MISLKISFACVTEMRATVLLLALFAACSFVFVNAAVIPVHLPVTALTTDVTYAVPNYTGVFDVITPEASEWQLPAIYDNGGQVYPGQFLIIRNHGPACITLLADPSETVEGAASYVIGYNTSVSLLSWQDWTVYAVSAWPQSNGCFAV